MRKTSKSKSSALAHKLYYSSHAQDSINKGHFLRTNYIRVLKRKNSINNGSAMAQKLYYSSHAQ